MTVILCGCRIKNRLGTVHTADVLHEICAFSTIKKKKHEIHAEISDMLVTRFRTFSVQILVWNRRAFYTEIRHVNSLLQSVSYSFKWEIHNVGHVTS